MNVRIFILFFLTLFTTVSLSQVVITTNNYSQDFGNSPIFSWTNNATFTGWYNDGGPFQGLEDIDGGNPSNTGGLYSYVCNGGNDVKIGFRPSNGSGGGPCNTSKNCGHAIGLRILNNTGSQITSIEVTYTAYQMSMADDCGNINNIFFDYQIGAGLNTVGMGQAGWTSVGALDYEAPQVSGICSSGQDPINPSCSESSVLSSCIPLTVNNGQEIMLRWLDNNDSYNDPHLAIDNVNILFYLDGPTCNSALPVHLENFAARRKDESVNLFWNTSSEINSDYFEVERSLDAVQFEHVGYINASGTSNSYKQYTMVDNNPINHKVSYYRLKQVDLDGNYTYSSIVSVKPLEQIKIIGYYNALGQEIPKNSKGVVIVRYSDGTTERKYNP